MPTILEYIDPLTMSAITASAGLELGVPQDVKDAALAYLVVVIESRRDDRVEEDTGELAALVDRAGRPRRVRAAHAVGRRSSTAREKAFWTAKANDADDIIDMVVPRAAIPAYLAEVQALAAETGSLVVGCGHAGDGNVHLSVFQPDEACATSLVGRILAAGVALGGAVSGEHGIGREEVVPRRPRGPGQARPHAANQSRVRSRRTSSTPAPSSTDRLEPAGTL